MRQSVRRRIQLALWARQSATFTDLEQPEDWPAYYRVDTAGLWPLQQGDYSTGFSAAFAAVNGARILASPRKPLSVKDEQALLAWAWEWSRGRKPLHPTQGLRRTEFSGLVACVIERLNGRYGHSLWVWQPWLQRQPTRQEFFMTVERLLVGGHVLLALFAGANYSVIRGYTAESLLLFDSAGRRWVKKLCLSIDPGRSGARHQLLARSTLALRRTS